MTGTGRRVLAVACKELDNIKETSEKSAESNLTFIGLLGFSDRLREEVEGNSRNVPQCGNTCDDANRR